MQANLSHARGEEMDHIETLFFGNQSFYSFYDLFNAVPTTDITHKHFTNRGMFLNALVHENF